MEKGNKSPEKETETKNTEKTRLKYANYHVIEVVCENVSPILGGRVGSPDECLKYDLDQVNVFERTNGGDILFPARWFRACCRDAARMIGISESAIMERVGFDDGIVDLNGNEIEIERMKISPKVKGIKQGREANFEKIAAGTKFTTSFAVPAKGIGIEKFRKLLENAGKWIGIGAFRKGFGRFKVVEFKDLGEI